MRNLYHSCASIFFPVAHKECLKGKKNKKKRPIYLFTCNCSRIAPCSFENFCSNSFRSYSPEMTKCMTDQEKKKKKKIIDKAHKKEERKKKTLKPFAADLWAPEFDVPVKST